MVESRSQVMNDLAEPGGPLGWRLLDWVESDKILACVRISIESNGVRVRIEPTSELVDFSIQGMNLRERPIDLEEGTVK